MLTFQIGHHIADLPLLKLIQSKLKCGQISVSEERYNYFINDQASLINVILPVFKFVLLNSSKYFNFLVFEKVVNFIKNKYHLTSEGNLAIIIILF